MQTLEASLRDQTMTEKEKFEYQLAQRDLTEEQIARAREIFDLTHQQQQTAIAGNVNAVSGVSSAVGSIRMAGSIDYSQQRMASSLDMIKAASQRTSDNTQKLVDAHRSA